MNAPVRKIEAAKIELADPHCVMPNLLHGHARAGRRRKRASPPLRRAADGDERQDRAQRRRPGSSRTVPAAQAAISSAAIALGRECLQAAFAPVDSMPN